MVEIIFGSDNGIGQGLLLYNVEVFTIKIKVGV